jgi:uncharacterized protein YcfL
MRLLPPIGLLGLAFVLLAGCGVACKTKPPVGGMRVESYPKTSITVNAKLFDGWFTVKTVAIAERQNLLNAQITLENLKGDARIEYRFQWLDEQGVGLMYHTPLWVAASVSRRELVLLKGIAPNPEVKDFILEVRMRQASTRW